MFENYACKLEPNYDKLVSSINKEDRIGSNGGFGKVYKIEYEGNLRAIKIVKKNSEDASIPFLELIFML